MSQAPGQLGGVRRAANLVELGNRLGHLRRDLRLHELRLHHARLEDGDDHAEHQRVASDTYARLHVAGHAIVDVAHEVVDVLIVDTLGDDLRGEEEVR